MSAYEPPFKRKTPQVRARSNEKLAAKRLGGRSVAMSGAGRQKGDVRTSLFRGEHKETSNASYSLKLTELHKIEREALLTPPGLLPYMHITIQGEPFLILREQDGVALGFEREAG